MKIKIKNKNNLNTKIILKITKKYSAKTIVII